MSNLLTIRPIATTDYSQWQILWEGYNNFYERNSFPIEITHMTWSRFFDTSEPIYALVEEKNGQLLGLVYYLFHRSTIQIELTCYLQDIFTVEKARGQGIGKALIEAVYEQAKIMKSPRVYWQHRKII